MSEGAAAPALPPEALAVFALLGKALSGLPEGALDLGLGESPRCQEEASRLSKALPFSLLLWLRGLHASGELKALAARERTEAQSAGVPEEDLESAVLLGFGVLLAKQLQMTLLREAEKR